MKLKRIQVKAFVEDSTGADPAALVPVFHRWIQSNALDELLIDVARYEHVEGGPGVMLIAHEADYLLDLAHGRPGLRYTRKRSMPPTVIECLELAVRQLLAAAHLLEQDAALDGRFRFRTDELEFIFADRLRLPNREESFDLVREDVRSAVHALYGVDDVEVSWTRDDPRMPLAVTAKIAASPAVSELAARAAASE